MVFRLLDPKDAPQAAALRMKLLGEVTDKSFAPGFSETVEQVFSQNLISGSAMAMGAFHGDTLISTAMLCRYRALPDEYNESGHGAVLCNVYTLEAHRGQGIMTRLLRMLLDEAREAGIGEVILTAEEAAVPLYEKFGFVPMKGAMVLNLC